VEALLANPDIAALARSLAEHPGVPMPVVEQTRWAAVAVVLRGRVGHEPELLLIKRAEHDGDPWSGHVACPGGRAEPGDRDLAHTASRETWEETGIDLERDGRILGALDDITPRSAFLPPIVIRPFVAVVAPTVTLTTSAEVAAAFWVGLTAVRDPARWRTATVRVAGGASREERAFLHEDHTVWGLTERILGDIRRRIELR
jgi:8-oxo-dGTP pyrophosphatase MutT (NUDIX family)